MKRCSQCEFLYEDDQNVCDMDGQALIHDNGLTLPPSQTQALLRVTPSGIKRSAFHGVALPAGVGLLLAGLFSVGFYVSPASSEPEVISAQIAQQNQNASTVEGSLASSAESGVSAFELQASAEPDAENVNSTTSAVRSDDVQARSDRSNANAVDPRVVISRGLPPLPRIRPLPRLPDAKPLARRPGNAGTITTSATTTTRRPTATDPSIRKNSKVSSFLKKTGRVLSKPFRL